MKTVGERIQWALSKISRTPSELARGCKVSRNAVHQWLMPSGTRPTEKNLVAAARYLGVDYHWLDTGKGHHGLRQSEENNVESSVDADLGRVHPGTILEIDVRVGAGPGGVTIDAYVQDGSGNSYAAENIRGEWILPEAVMREYLRTTARNIRVFEVIGDSMEPRLYEGDRVFIDIRFTYPVPEGIFALFDGYGLVIKRLQIVHNSDPLRIKIIPINEGYDPREALAEEIRIVGRLAGRFTTR